MTAQTRDYERMGIWRLRELARQQHPEHDDEATRVFVRRVLDMEVERRTLHGTDHLQGIGGSPIAPGHAPGGTDIAREPLATLYDRGIRYHESHEAVRRWLAWANIPERQLLALLIQARKLDRRAHGSEWAASYHQIAADIARYAHLLGFDGSVAAGRAFDCIEERAVEQGGRRQLQVVPRSEEERAALADRHAQGQEGGRRRVRTAHQVPAFKNGQAIKDAAKSAKAQLIFLAKLGGSHESDGRGQPV
ncbi:hypothetical protein [Halomonas organivorans]|uniref:Uncharacterized protein n=1 Tax=Halomonas organivorans TaxID=257772 RepID=A0A7W5C1U9_9GAMM|nr:hypothetical protein [Halomonas organivorans]MBB3142808.1 hypothetical protein [Halomonas organivorans]